jgi:hypothetical protein
MMKAKTALTLSKNYRQDRAMEWGFLTEPEQSHRARQSERARPPSGAIDQAQADERLDEPAEEPA